MKPINLENIRIEFPESPIDLRNQGSRKVFLDYGVYGFLENIPVGNLTLSICEKYPLEERGSYWFDKTNGQYKPWPVIIFQKTEEEFRGQGVSGRLIILANKISKERFNQPLASDIQFFNNPVANYADFNYAPHPAIRVWEKLEEQGLADYKPIKKGPRWIMK